MHLHLLPVRGTAHTIHNFGDSHLLVTVTPGGFNRFFEELSSFNRGLPAPDLVGTEQLMHQLSFANLETPGGGTSIPKFRLASCRPNSLP